MLYLFDSKLAKSKSLNIGLKSIFGLGLVKGNLLVKRLGFCENLKVENLSKKQIYELIKLIKLSNVSLGIDLKKLRFLSFKKALKIKLIKGFRKNSGLPVRGQKTRTNGRTVKKQKKNNVLSRRCSLIG